MLFAKGFGDGAKGSFIKHPEHEDYVAGWHAGQHAKADAIKAYCREHKLPAASALR